MSDFIDLSDKTVLVTGGSRGIGEGIVRSLVAEGANVVLNYSFSKERAEAIADELDRDRCLPVQGYMDRCEDLDRLWAEAVKWKGRVDVLVNNAAVRQPVSMEAPSKEWDDHWIYTLRVNLVATAHLSRLAVLHYQGNGGGIIIGISARIAVRGDRPDFFHDGASKGGMNSLLRGIARFYAKDNIQTYILCARRHQHAAGRRHAQHLRRAGDAVGNPVRPFRHAAGCRQRRGVLFERQGALLVGHDHRRHRRVVHPLTGPRA